MRFSMEIFEKHPYATGLGVFLLGIAVWYFFLRGKGGNVTPSVTVTQPGTSDADYQQAMAIGAQYQMAQLQSQTQLAGQTQQLQAQLAEQSNALTVQSQQNELNYSLGKIKLQDESTASTQQFQLQESALQTQQAMQENQLNNQLQEQQAGYAAQIEGLKIGANSAIAQDTINANLQQNLAAITAQVQNNAINAESQDMQAQLNTQAIINGQNTSEAEHQSNNSLFGSIVGGLIGAFL